MNTPSLRLSRAQRLRSPSDYQRVYQSRQFGVSAHHSFNVISGSDIEEANKKSVSSRLGVTVSKKVSNKAVVRNQFKRQIKEFYRSHQGQLSAADLVITARPSCARVTKRERKDSLQELWIKILKWQRWRNATASKVEH